MIGQFPQGRQRKMGVFVVQLIQPFVLLLVRWYLTGFFNIVIINPGISCSLVDSAAMADAPGNEPGAPLPRRERSSRSGNVVPYLPPCSSGAPPSPVGGSWANALSALAPLVERVVGRSIGVAMVLGDIAQWLKVSKQTGYGLSDDAQITPFPGGWV